MFASKTSRSTISNQREESVMLVARQSPRKNSHYYCLTSEGPKAFFDEGIHEVVEAGQDILVTYEAGSTWAYPVLETPELREKLDAQQLVRIRHRMQERQRQAFYEGS